MNKKSDEGTARDTTGFAGLSSMLSDVDVPAIDRQANSEKQKSPAPPEESGTSAASPSYPTKSPPISQSAQPGPKPESSFQLPVSSSGGGSGRKWLIGVAVLIAWIWLVSFSDKKSSHSDSEYQPASSASEVSNSSVDLQGASVPAQVDPLPAEEYPPIGTGHILNLPQLRYCAAQNIRLDAAKEIVNQNSNSDVYRFNSLIDDYNSRCGNFQYRRGSLESTRGDVEKFRGEYIAQGRQLIPHVDTSPRESTSPRSVPIDVESGGNPSTSDSSSDQLSSEEEESLEAACSSDKYLRGPAAYQACRSRKISELRRGPRRPDLSTLSSDEHESIEAACSSEKFLKGPASYNRCLNSQLRALGSAHRQPSLEMLSSDEHESIEAACSTDKYLNGPASYNQCLTRQLAALSRQTRKPDLSGLSAAQRESIDSACSTEKYINGPAAYNNCLSRQLRQLR